MEIESSSTLIAATTRGQIQPHEFDHFDSDRDVLCSEEVVAMEISLKNEDMELSSVVTNKYARWVDVHRKRGKKKNPYTPLIFYSRRDLLT